MINRRIKKLAVMFMVCGLALVQCNYVFAATINSVKGTVQVRKGGGQKKTKATAGMFVTKGDIICTGYGSSAKITLDGGKQVSLSANTIIYIKDLNTVSQSKGSSVTSGSSKNHYTQVPTAIMGVKGTTYGVQQKQDNTLVSLPEGELEIVNNDGSKISLNKNQQIELNSNGKNSQQPLNLGNLDAFVFDELSSLKYKYDNEVLNKFENAQRPEEDNNEEVSVNENNITNYSSSKRSSSSSSSKKSTSNSNSNNNDKNNNDKEQSQYYKIINPIDGNPSIKLKPNTVGKQVSFSFDNTTNQQVKDIIVRNSQGEIIENWHDGDTFGCYVDSEDITISFVVEKPDEVKIIY